MTWDLSITRWKGTLFQWISVDQFECAAPAGLSEEMRDHIHDVVEPDIAISEVGRRRLKGPVDNKRRALDVFPRHESPIAAVGGVVAVVAHGENVAGWYDHFAVDHVLFEHFKRRLHHAD